MAGTTDRNQQISLVHSFRRHRYRDCVMHFRRWCYAIHAEASQTEIFVATHDDVACSLPLTVVTTIRRIATTVIIATPHDSDFAAVIIAVA